MTFLQPWLLWALPLVALPIIIHLLNRVRYRSLDWAAMSFLLSASRRSSRHAKLRHWLILLCRALGLGALILMVARPLAGGWLGWALHGAPDTVLLLLDRSASMEVQPEGARVSKRELALKRWAEAAQETAGATRFVLLDSATLAPQEVGGASALAEVGATAATDTAADIPALLDAAVNYVLAAQSGHTELWLASDLQRSNWHPESPRWAELGERIKALPSEVRVRLLALTRPPGGNAAARIEEVRRSTVTGNATVKLTLDFSRDTATPVTLPLTVAVEGARTPLSVRMEGAQLRLQHVIDLGDRKTGGWGWVELPADDNLRDNRAWFAFSPDVHLRALVVSDDATVGRLLETASAPAPAALNQSAELSTVAKFEQAELQAIALIVWQAPWPDGGNRRKLEEFIQGGGVVVAFAAGGTDAVFGEPTKAAADHPFRVTNWNAQDGLLAKTADGEELPVSQLAVTQRQPIQGEWSVLGAFADGAPFLARRRLGAGMLYACATSPLPALSTLGEGLVLVPMLQRALQEGGQRLGTVVNAVCGDQHVAELLASAKRVDGEPSSPWSAGVYQAGQRWIVLNRPAAEDDRDALDEAAVRAAFGPVSLRFFEERGDDSGRLQSEVWRLFLWAMLFFLLAEAMLALPGRARSGEETSTSTSTSTRAEEAEAVTR